MLEAYNRTAAEPLKKRRATPPRARCATLTPAVTAARHPEILFYDVNYMSEPVLSTQEEAFAFLQKEGFKTFGYRLCRTQEEVRAAIDDIEVQRKRIDVLTDGAVVKLNDFAAREQLGYTDKFPRWAIAFKFEAEEAQTVVREVIWQVGRTGKLTPLALVDPVELAGATVRRATLNNMGDIRRKGGAHRLGRAHPPQQRGHPRDPRRRRGRGRRAAHRPARRLPLLRHRPRRGGGKPLLPQ